MGKYVRYGGVFCLGALGYPLLEILWRGYTHISMAILGGICLCSIVWIDRAFAASPPALPAFFATLWITLLEFFVGLLLNRVLGWGVWDYSKAPWNLCGQVCLSYSALWFLLSLGCIFLRRGCLRLFSASKSPSP